MMTVKSSGLFAVLFIFLILIFTGCSTRQTYIQPKLGHQNIRLITRHHLKFRDLNKNRKLDKYEDWRLPIDERINDLVSKMTLEEKVGFMIISQINMNRTEKGYTSDLVENDDLVTTDIFTGKKLAVPQINASGTTKGIMERHLRHFILRANAPAGIISEWSNKVQAVAESSRLGIPVIIASNPRNHITAENNFGFNVENSVFTQWPGTLGLSATNDLSIIREFAESAAREWVSTGLRKGYMYQADLATEPRWSRIDGTFGEDADWVSEIMKEIVLGFQGEKPGSNSVALTTKHFPGAGPEENGQDAHFEYGKNLVYPGHMLDYQLRPFIAAIDAGTSAVMPYYALPHKTELEEVGCAFNKGVLTDVLRNTLGFKGIINSDTGPIHNMPWGVEDLSVSERYAKALEAGVDIFSGPADPSELLETTRKGLVTEDRINQSVVRLLKEKFELGLFENPYSDPVIADSIVNNEVFRQKADLAFHKSIVLLRNRNSVLPLKPGTKICFITSTDDSDKSKEQKVIIPDKNNWDLSFTESPADADLLLICLIPRGKMSRRSQSGPPEPIINTLSKNSVDVDYVKKLIASKPSVVVINFSKPWVISEIDNNNLNTLIATFGTTASALLDVVTGRFNPVGKMPFAIPVSQKAVEENMEDVPGVMEQQGYSLFNFRDGLSY
jgi:beta-glucosidase